MIYVTMTRDSDYLLRLPFHPIVHMTTPPQTKLLNSRVVHFARLMYFILHSTVIIAALHLVTNCAGLLHTPLPCVWTLRRLWNDK